MHEYEKRRKLNLLVISDLHYDAKVDSPVKERRARLGVELLRRVRKSMDCSAIDLIVVLGDLIDDGSSENSKKYLLEIKKELGCFGKEYLVIPGNHDGDIGEFHEVFDQQDPILSMNGYQCVSFSDVYDMKDAVEVSKIYEENEVFLSLSGHYHFLLNFMNSS